MRDEFDNDKPAISLWTPSSMVRPSDMEKT